MPEPTGEETRSSAESEYKSFQLGQCLGKGSFGEVFKALDVRDGRMVAKVHVPAACMGYTQH